MKRPLFFILALLFWCHSTIHPTLFTDTLIKTAQGLVHVGMLNTGDRVSSRDLDKQRSQETTVKTITPKAIDTIVAIKTSLGVVIFPADQKLYDPHLKRWIAASNLTSANRLIDSNGRKIAIINIEKRNATHSGYSITLDYPHTFFASHQELLVHNCPPLVIGFSFAFEGFLSGLTLSSFSFGVGMVGLTHFFANSNDKGPRKKFDDLIPRPSSSPTPDNDESKGQTVIWFTPSKLKKAVEKNTSNANDMHHIFQQKHKLEPLIQKFNGNRAQVIEEVLKAADGHIPATEGEIFGRNPNLLIVNVFGFKVNICGRIIDGIPRLATIFIE